MATSHEHTHSSVEEGANRSVYPPILKLHDDLLWRIFMINATLDDKFVGWGQGNQPKNPALETARFTSQVCTQWRAVILGSPTIWGNSIDLQLLRRKSDHWRKEVLKRTGSGPLWISGDVLGDNEISIFFSSLLNDNWERIRGLDIRVFGFSSLDYDMWRSFRSAAPNLEVLRVQFHSIADPSSLTSRDPESFFAGKAPRLREFHCPRMSFSMAASWVPQLQALTLSYPQSIYDLFSTADMPFLETLDILKSLQITDIRVSGNLVNKKVLPRLKSINLEHGFKTCLTILERITASHLCALHLSTDDSDLTDVTSDEISALQAMIAHYSKGYFNTTPTQKLILHVSANVFSMSAPTATRIPPSTFRVNIYSTLALPQDIFSPCIKSFSSCDFSSVTIFRLFIFHDYETYKMDIINFISVLPSVEILHVTKNAIRFLLDLPKERRKVFPVLHTLTLGYRENLSSPMPPLYPDILLSLLVSRRDEGMPVEFLDLVDCPFDHIGNLGFLEGMTSLRVRWKRPSGFGFDEYICGSGTPSMLDLRTNAYNV
ncbi:hypothetical protein GALMADRAFT_256116 [Galerina marginata CBS 339.88]|uniref:F-box domain-containing protein n=1 Tax=Galerina marginata (strain CBS 339.88) TaxID=685588 RepID=A0A067SGZ2_GALM3|nr:hypothetical protein GALMADRAFT_256116 [Galerina marginata CBS 339.88]